MSTVMSAGPVDSNSDGIAFSVRIEDIEHRCLISDCALKHLYAFEGTTLDLLHVYRAYEARIHAVARQMILSGGNAPLVLQAMHFDKTSIH